MTSSSEPSNKHWHVYTIVNEAGRSYVGATYDVSPERRLREHNGMVRGAKATRGKGPWRLVYAERIGAGKNACLSREWHLKRERSFRRQVALNWKKATAEDRAVTL